VLSKTFYIYIDCTLFIYFVKCTLDAVKYRIIPYIPKRKFRSTLNLSILLFSNSGSSIFQSQVILCIATATKCCIVLDCILTFWYFTLPNRCLISLFHLHCRCLSAIFNRPCSVKYLLTFCPEYTYWRSTHRLFTNIGRGQFFKTNFRVCLRKSLHLASIRNSSVAAYVPRRCEFVPIPY
jgi:hypothetical protein